MGLARKNFIEVGGVLQNASAPRFDRTPAVISQVPGQPGQDTRALLVEAGYASDQIEALFAGGAVGGPIQG
ncbi:MAG: hypothetical protein SH820_14170 [Xanthomonadales bacterium]|nr:hypothetical protein [Xanthomonadales bacterium]